MAVGLRRVLALAVLLRPCAAERVASRPHEQTDAAAIHRGGRARRLLAPLLALAGGSRAQVADLERSMDAGALFVQLDRDYDGAIDRQEFSAFDAAGVPWSNNVAPDLEELFGRADMDGDGSLTPRETEYFVYLAEVFQQSAPGGEGIDLGNYRTEVFEAFDADQDGGLNVDEYTRFVAHAALMAGYDGVLKSNVDAWSAKHFTRADIDGSGALNQAEAGYGFSLMRDAVNSGHFLRMMAVSQLVLVADIDQDGAISWAELDRAIAKVESSGQATPFVRSLRRFFPDADADGDGRLDSNEVHRLVELLDLFHDV